MSRAVTSERGLLITLAGVQFTHILDFMIMMPLGPLFTELFGISDARFGLLVSAYTLAAGASGLLATLYVDRFDRRRLLLWLYAGFALATLACGLAPGYGSLMLARVLAGLFGGVLGALIQTVVGDAVPFERRGRAMGLIMMSFSLATVVGVPASLWLATRYGWHAPFLALALGSALIGAAGMRTLPRLDAHLQQARAHAVWPSLLAVLREPNHWRAMAFTALVVGAGFLLVPYVTIYATRNVQIAMPDVPMIYLAGGVATIFTSRLWGVLADRWGQVRTFRLIAALSLLPIVLMTHLPAVPLLGYLAVSTLFFVFLPGRMVPMMAIVTSASTPQMRGSFMSLNGAAQSASMGLAALVGGLLIGRDGAGRLTGYDIAGWLAVLLTLLAIVWAAQVRVRADPVAAAAVSSRA